MLAMPIVDIHFMLPCSATADEKEKGQPKKEGEKREKKGREKETGWREREREKSH
jgi:hypothetical protein